MNFPPELIASLWCWLGHLLFWPLLAWAAWRAPWWHLRDHEATHVWLGTCVALLLLWQVRATLPDGSSLHLLGATLLTLMFGRHFALLSLTLILAAATLAGTGGWSTLGLNGLLMGVVPVSLSYGILRAVERWLPRNYFVYLFGAAFFGAGMTLLLSGVISAGVLAAQPLIEARAVLAHHLPLHLLLAFQEAFITGLMMAIFVVYRPRWVATFDDRRYLQGK